MKRNEESFEFVVGLNRYWLKWFGLWPHSDRFSSHRLFVTLLMAISLLIPMTACLFESNDFPGYIEILSTLIPVIMITIKILILRMKRNYLRLLVEEVARDWKNFGQLELYEKDVMMRYAKLGRLINIICIAFAFLAQLGIDTAPLTVSRRNPGPRVFPTSTKYSFDSKLSPAYELIYIEQCVAIAVCSISNLSIDCFLFLLVFHVCGQLTILSRLIERYHESQDEDDLLELGTRCRCFRCIVENHVRLTRFMNLVESSFNGLILWQFLNNTVLFCVHGYHIVMDVNAQDTISILIFVSVLIAIAFDFFIYCYVGEAIICKSEEIGYSAYQALWYDLSPGTARFFIILILRSRKPFNITAGKFYIMSMSSFMNILKTSGAYLSVLKAIK